jgi:3',5'-cyclic-nucleotide phosphodiesterase
VSIRVLGCSGGLSGENQQGSTCIQISPSTLIDAGTGLASLSLAEMSRIRHIFLTHAHMDHIAALPAFLSNLFEQDNLPVKVYGLAETLARLKANIFNDEIWPDFTRVIDGQQSVVELVEVAAGDIIEHDGMTLELFAVKHKIPTVGYSVKSEAVHYVFCADCTESAQLVADLNRLAPIDVLMIECAFPDRLIEVAEKTQHMTPGMLQRTLAQVSGVKHVWVTHLKPSYEKELRSALSSGPWTVL